MTIRRTVKTTILAAATLGAMASSALAADVIAPPVIAAPVIEEIKPFGGWYIRGDIGYAFAEAREEGKKKRATGCPTAAGCSPNGVALDPLDPFGGETEFEDMVSVGGGVGYQLNEFLRADITATGYFDGETVIRGDSLDPLNTGTTTIGEFDALVLMANAYVDFGTYAGITPYVGAGVGFASIDYDDVTTESIDFTDQPLTTENVGEEELRLAWSLAAGASYDVSDNVALDAGYRFTRIREGEIAALDPLGFGDPQRVKDGGVDLHEVRVGARYKFH